MPSIPETFWSELTARLKAPPLFGVPVLQIKREHRVPVTREKSPAVYVVEGTARLLKKTACDWRWEMPCTVEVYARGDEGLTAADAILCEVVQRINPEAATPIVAYANGVNVELVEIAPDTEIADEDATAVKIELLVQFATRRWTIDAPAAG